MSLPCEECIKTDNHCCVASVPYLITDAMYYKHRANQLGIECIIIEDQAHEGMVVLVNNSMRGKDIHYESCVFLKDNRCSVYDDRPTICRAYGTECMPCVYHINGMTTAEQIGSLSTPQVEHMTKRDIKLDDIFNDIMNGKI